MIEVKVAGLRLNGFNGNDVAVRKGTFMYNSGAFLAAHNPSGEFGSASVGSTPRMLPADQYTHSGFAVYPVNKLILQTEGADQGLDTIASGVSLIYYEGGQYETDEYDITVSGTGVVGGENLWLNSSGQIALSSSATANPAGWSLPPIGAVVQVSDFPSTSRWYNGGASGTGVDNFKKTVWYRLYPSHATPAGNDHGGF